MHIGNSVERKSERRLFYRTDVGQGICRISNWGAAEKIRRCYRAKRFCHGFVSSFGLFPVQPVEFWHGRHQGSFPGLFCGHCARDQSVLSHWAFYLLLLHPQDRKEDQGGQGWID